MLREVGVKWAPALPRVSAESTDALVPAAEPAAVPATEPAPPPTPSPSAVPQPMPAPAPMPRADRAARADPVAAPALASPVDGLGWEELRAAVSACRACGLCETRTRTVFGAGSQQAHWMIVGEAPGEQEDLSGEPFVGAAGRLLDAMLAALGLSRREAAAATPAAGAAGVYIANTLKCRPPGNRNPQPDELARCEPFLKRQIALLQPRIVVAMGRFAVQSLLRSSEPIGRLRGRVHRYEGVPLVVTYHPAYLLRNPADKAKAWADLCLAAATYEDRGVSPGAAG
jgi:uracil-DNA glycosylase family 4